MRPLDSFVGQPIRSLQTMLRVIAKDDKRIPLVVPDGIYGPTTMNAVAAFQRLNQIPPTGVTDQNTWEAINNVYDNARIRIEKAAPIEVLLEPGQVITAGEQNPYIYILQGMLSFLSETNTMIPPPSATGILDEETAASIIAFQQIAALDQTGDLDRITWLYLVEHFTLNAHDWGKTI